MLCCARNDYRDYVELCFKEFGDLVKYWLTVNEPFSFADGGYDGGFVGNMAPYRCSPWANCPQGNSATEPYIVGHHLLLCHAEAVKVYKEKFQVRIQLIYLKDLLFSNNLLIYLSIFMSNSLFPKHHFFSPIKMKYNFVMDYARQHFIVRVNFLWWFAIFIYNNL